MIIIQVKMLRQIIINKVKEIMMLMIKQLKKIENKTELHSKNRYQVVAASHQLHKNNWNKNKESITFAMLFTTTFVYDLHIHIVYKYNICIVCTYVFNKIVIIIISAL